MVPHRYACDILREARAAVKNLNHLSLPLAKRHLSTLIEELQTVVNRMEAGLSDRKSYAHVRAELKDGKAELKRLRADLRKAKKDLNNIDAQIEHYTKVRAKALEEILASKRFQAPLVEISGKE